jgi:3,4-dihydroxy 2-butanone 4-phosphate synthase/GTP cyclohydrolase II
MARLDDLIAFAQLHNLKIGTIRDLIAYRRRNDHNVEKVAEVNFESRYGGEWRAITYRNKAVGTETLALVKGRITPDTPTLVRMHTLSIFSDSLGEMSGRSGILQGAMREIGEVGEGVVVIINRALVNAMSTVVRARAEGKTIDSPDMNELRDYGVGAQILTELGVHDMILLTNSRHTLVALAGYGLNIVGEQPISTEGL